MKVLPLLLVGGALGGASWLGGDAVAAPVLSALDARWEMARLRVPGSASDHALVVQVACEGGCTLRVALEDVPPAG